jgi:TolB protein
MSPLRARTRGAELGARDRSRRRLLTLAALLSSCQSSPELPLVAAPGHDASAPPDPAEELAQDAPPSLPQAPVDAGRSTPRADASAASDDDCIARRFPITFVSTRAPPTVEYELYVMTEDGSEVQRIGQGGHYTNPVWSPDGSSIAFHHVSPGLASYIGVIAPDDATTTPLTPFTMYLRPTDVGSLPDGPTWSPDGQTLAFAAPLTQTSWRIYQMARSGGQQRALLPELELSHAHPRFARHDTRLAYVVESDQGADLWVVDVNDPSRQENLTRGRVQQPEWPRWSPDDRQIAFSALDVESADAGGGDTEIFVLTLATGGIRQVTDDSAFDRHPSWSPDGESLLFSSHRPCGTLDDCNDLWRVRVDGSEPALQLTTTGREYFPDWYGGSSCPSAR